MCNYWEKLYRRAPLLSALRHFPFVIRNLFFSNELAIIFILMLDMDQTVLLPSFPQNLGTETNLLILIMFIILFGMLVFVRTRRHAVIVADKFVLLVAQNETRKYVVLIGLYHRYMPYECHVLISFSSNGEHHNLW